jgi:uncharacterized protein with HEPN domain
VDPDLAQQIADTGRIIAFRNQLTHGYPNIVHETVWGILEGKLPALRAQVSHILDNA